MAWTEERKGRHYGYYRDAQGKKRSVPSSTSKRLALKAAQDKEAEIRNGTWFTPGAGKKTLNDYFTEQWLPNRLGEKRTLASYDTNWRMSIRDSIGNLPLEKIEPAVVQRWVIEQQKAGVTPATIKARYKTLATILGAKKGVSAVRDRLIQNTPCEGIDLPTVDKREVDLYSVEEYDQLARHAAEWIQPVMLLAAETGMRWGELMGLQVNDFSEDFRIVSVRRTMLEIGIKHTGNGTPYEIKPRPKGVRQRHFAIDPEVGHAMAAMVRARHLFPSDRLFSKLDKNGHVIRTPEWPAGLPLGRSHMRSEWMEMHRRAGLRLRRFHDLRGSHISWLLAGGADIATVMKRVGHEQMSTTQVYVDAMHDADVRALSALRATKDRARKDAKKKAKKKVKKGA